MIALEENPYYYSKTIEKLSKVNNTYIFIDKQKKDSMYKKYIIYTLKPN